MGELEGIESFLFIDEVKNSTNNGDLDNSFYYFAVAVPKSVTQSLRQELQALISHLPNGFHAKNLYKTMRPDLSLMNAITDLMIKYKLVGICYRYDRDLLYDRTITYVQPHISDQHIAGRMANWEFQAFFYFIQNIYHIPEKAIEKIAYPICCFIDRGIYGVNEIEGVDFAFSDLVKRAVFVSREDMSELALPDHLGYVFSKCRKAYPTFHPPANDILSTLQSTAYGEQLLKLLNHRLFCYIEADQWFEKLSKAN